MARARRYDKNYFPSYTSRRGGRKGCLCWDKNTYSRECCDGSLRAQGIGGIASQGQRASYLMQENGDYLLQENRYNIELDG